MKSKEQIKRDSDEYKAVLAGAVSDLVIALDPEDEQPLEEQFEAWIHDTQNSHPWLLDDFLAVNVLMYANHPSAELFHSNCTAHRPTDNFPFCTMAAGAFADDIRELLGREYLEGKIINEKNLRELVTDRVS